MDLLSRFYASLTTFEINEYNYTEVVSLYEYKYSLPFERFEGTPAVTRFLQNYWQHTITVSVSEIVFGLYLFEPFHLAYYLLIKSIQWAMSSRPPFDLRLPLIIWNLSLAIFSVCGLLRFGEDFIMNIHIRGVYSTVCTNPPTKGVAPFWCFLFLISKLVEMGDTLFIVLRKRPLIFLHYYHHVVVLIYTAHSGAEHATPGRAFIAMNYAAHSLMYSYYAARAMGFKTSEMVSVCITVAQTIQMIVGVAISVWTFFVKTQLGWKCQQSYPNLYMGFFIYFTFAFLFIQFFVNRYLKSKRKAERMDVEKKDQ